MGDRVVLVCVYEARSASRLRPALAPCRRRRHDEVDEVLRDGEVVEDIDDRLTAYRVLATPLQAISALNQIAAEWDMKAPTR